MADNPSMTMRIIIGKSLGFAIGLISFFSLPSFYPEASLTLRWGFLLWYTTMGLVVGLIGVITWHPVLKIPMPWWVRAPLIGGWMNLVLVFFTYDMMVAMFAYTFGPGGLWGSPWWFALEGAIVGLVISYATTRFGGEGKESVDL